MRMLIRFLLGVGLMAGVIVVAPAGAQAVTSADGYVWADRASDPSYTVTNGYWYNSAGGAIQIERPSAGVYAVRFVGMAVSGGIAHARPYGSGNTAICTVANWRPSGADEVVNIRCFDASGVPADTRFTANFTNRPSAVGTYAYLWANQASPAFDVPYTPSATYSYDSTGVAPQVWRQSVGVYMMVIGAVSAHYPLTDDDGVYQITAYGKNAVRCEVHGENDETPPPIGVFCKDANGVPADTRFSVTYAHSVSIQGSGVAAANANWRHFADDPVGSWTIEGYWNTGGAPTLTRLAAGQYRVTFPGFLVVGGHAYAGSRGDPSSYCHVAWWSWTTVDVHCFHNVTDTAVDSDFNVAMTH